MSDSNIVSFFVADIGNSSVHVGLFDGAIGEPLSQPVATFACDARANTFESLERWLGTHPTKATGWYIASVNDPARQRLGGWLAKRQASVTIHSITPETLPLKIEVANPERVGIDRLLAAVAVNRLRDKNRPAIVIDAGTAITVDCVNAAGAFLGGAILPGMRMAAQALDHYTDKLPLIDVSTLKQPAPIGRNTEAAMQSGIFWGTRGAILQLAAQMCDQFDIQPQLFITGGDAQRLQLDDVQRVPHLVLSGIAVAVQQMQA